MKHLFVLAICLPALLWGGSGCRHSRPQPPSESSAPIPAPTGYENINVDYESYAQQVRTDPNLSDRVSSAIKLHRLGSSLIAPAQGLELLYGELTDPNRNSPAAVDTFNLFDCLGAKDVVRASLLHKSYGIVLRAAESIAADANAGSPDPLAVPYLIYALQKNNFEMPGSEIAMIHERMKQSMVAALIKITQMDVVPADVDVDHSREVEEVLTKAADWAAAHNIRLFEKFEFPPRQ